MSDVICKKCGDLTNYPPDEFPEEYRGYCPTCSLDLWQAGELPKPPLDLMVGQAIGMLVKSLGVEVRVVPLTPRSPSDIIDTPAGPVQYSTN